MLRENDLFKAAKYQDTEAHLFSTRREQPYLNAEAVDFEMQFSKRTDYLKITRLSQEGLEHFVRNYGHSYRILYLDDCTRIQDFSPLGDLPGLEALRIEWCRKADCLWDMSGNTSLKVLSIHDAKKIVANPMQLQTSQALEEIRLWGADFDNKHTLESLSCFQGMKSLKRIDLNMMKLQNRNLDILSTLPKLEEFHFDAGMLTTEEIAWICAKCPNLYGDCLGVYTTNEVTCLNDITAGGSKLNETARSYKMIAEEARQVRGVEFMWITDGGGWRSARRNLEETFNTMTHLYNIDDMENGVFLSLFR